MKYSKVKKKYKYTTRATFTLPLDIDSEMIITHVPYISIFQGRLSVHNGYAWDGLSGPTIDTKDSMVGSLVHDALYQLIREGYLDADWRAKVDGLLYRLLLDAGMPKWRASYMYWAVRKFGNRYAAPREVEVLEV